MSGKSRVRASSTRPPAARSAQPSAPTTITDASPDLPLQRLAASAGPGSRQALLSLQGAAGNRAVQRLVNEANALEEAAPAASPGLFNVPDAQLPAPGGGQPIPDQVRRGMEGALGQDFSEVRVHTDSSPDSVGALAYTQGNDVHFRPGMYQPDSQSGREALGHELAHVVQQRAGRVASPQGLGAPVNADPALEAEADAIGRQAARAMANGAALAEPAPAPSTTVEAPAQRIAAPVQRLTKEEELAALEQQQIVTRNIALFGGGTGGRGGATPGTGGAGGASSASTTSPPEMQGGEQAVADAVPETDADTGAPEGAAEAVDSLGEDAGPMAAMLEQMAAEVGPDNVLAALQSDFEADQSEDQAADASGLTSVPSTASGIADALNLAPPSTVLPALQAAQTSSEGAPETETMSEDEWDAFLERDMGRSRSNAIAMGGPLASEGTDQDHWDDWDYTAPANSLASLSTSDQGAISRPRSGAIDISRGDSTAEDVGTAFTGLGVAGVATQTSAEKARDWFGAAAGATSETAMIAQGAGGILGGGAALMDAGLAASRAHVSSGSAKVEEGAGATSALTGGAASVSNAAVGIEAARTGASGLASGANTLMMTAGTAAAGLSVATGSIDVIRGVGGAVAAQSRASQLEQMASASGGRSTDLGLAAAGAAESQRQKRNESAMTATKGALSVAGGAVLLALGLTNPIGLGLLAGAAVIGGAYALYKLWRNKKKKNADIGGGLKAEGEAKAELAATLFARGIEGGEAEYQAIVIQLGFDADKVRQGKTGGITQAHILQRMS